jgi:hypothetical protein
MASRFSGFDKNALSARKGSGFQNSANQASSDFASQLQSNRMNIRNQAIKDLMGMSNDLLNQRPYQNYLMKKDAPWWQQLLSGIVGQGSQFASTAGNAAIQGALF